MTKGQGQKNVLVIRVPRLEGKERVRGNSGFRNPWSYNLKSPVLTEVFKETKKSLETCPVHSRLLLAFARGCSFLGVSQVRLREQNNDLL